jgi:PAS domain-containing protein
VRSGRLAAVCIGARYEISEAAIERYLAEKQAMRRAPARARRTAPPADGLARATRALDAVTLDAITVEELVADVLATDIGDLAIVRELSPDGTTYLPAIVRHPDSVARATAAATVGRHPLVVAGSRVLEQVTGGETVVKEIVPQDCVRRGVDAEFTQYLDHAGIHSMVVAPARTSNGDVAGLVAVTRDEPGRPYTPADVAGVERAAAVVGIAIERGRLTSLSRNRRRALVDTMTRLLESNPVAATESIVQHGAIGELVCDTSGRVVVANEAAGAIVGIVASELPGRRLLELATAEFHVAHSTTLDRLVRGELAYADLRVHCAHCREPKDADLAVRLGVVCDSRAQPRAIVAVLHALAAVPPEAPGEAALESGTSTPA